MTQERWRVLTVQDRQTVDPAVGIVHVRRITFRTKDGFLGEIEMPKEEATEEAVREAIQAEVVRIEAIFKLTG